MKFCPRFRPRFDRLALAGLLVGLVCSGPAWAQDAPDVVWEVAGTNSVSVVAFAPDGQQVASGGGSQDPTVEVRDATDGSWLATFPAPSRSGAVPTGIASLDCSPAGLLAIGGSLISTGYPVPGGAADVWRLADETIVHAFGGNNVSFSADGTRLAIGGVVREIPSEAVLAQFSGGRILSPDGQTVATGDFDGEVTLWDVASGDLLRTLDNGGEVRALAFSPDSQMLASAGGGVDPDSTIKLWRVSDGALLHTLFGHGIGVSSVDFSPDGQLLISSGTDVDYERSIRFWRTTDGALLKTLDPGNAVRSVAFSPDGTTFVYGRVNGYVAVARTPLVAETDCNNGVCDPGEDCHICPTDCISGTGAAACGDGICQPGAGEDCISCALDCRGKLDGNPHRRYCCGDDV